MFNCIPVDISVFDESIFFSETRLQIRRDQLVNFPDCVVAIVKNVGLEELISVRRAAKIVKRRESVRIKKTATGNLESSILFKNVSSKPFVTRHRSRRAKSIGDIGNIDNAVAHYQPNSPDVVQNDEEDSNDIATEPTTSTMLTPEKVVQSTPNSPNKSHIDHSTSAENIDVDVCESNPMISPDMNQWNGENASDSGEVSEPDLSAEETMEQSTNAAPDVSEHSSNVDNGLSTNTQSNLLVQTESNVEKSTTEAAVLLPFLPHVDLLPSADLIVLDQFASVIDQTIPIALDLPNPIQPQHFKRRVPLLMPICDLMTFHQVKQYRPRRRQSGATKLILGVTEELRNASYGTTSKESVTNNESFSESEEDFGKLVYENSSFESESD